MVCPLSKNNRPPHWPGVVLRHRLGPTGLHVLAVAFSWSGCLFASGVMSPRPSIAGTGCVTQDKEVSGVSVPQGWAEEEHQGGGKLRCAGGHPRDADAKSKHCSLAASYSRRIAVARRLLCESHPLNPCHDLTDDHSMYRQIDGTKRYETLHPYETSQIVRKGVGSAEN